MVANLDVAINIRLNELIIRGAIPEIKVASERSKFIVLREYKKQIPVDTGFARRSVIAKRSGIFDYVVTTTATNEGYPYPLAVHDGTGILEGTEDVPSKGRVRRGEVEYGIGGIRPNRFAKRAKDITRPLVLEEFRKAIGKANSRQWKNIITNIKGISKIL